jgi:acyl-CoA reductase-like NAD-dependent aldehyde dehydrogenase
MLSYPLLIAGEPDPGRGWMHLPRASALLRDPERVMARIGELQRGAAPAATDEDLIAGRCAVGGSAENDRAVEAAHRARADALALPLELRRELGEEISDELHARSGDFADVLVAEGHPSRLARWEVDSILAGAAPQTMRWCFGQLRQAFEAGDRRLLLLRKPDGVVCVNPPQNAAGANASLGVPILLAGNTLVVKAPRATPLSVMFLYSEIVWPVLERRGCPPGMVNLVCASTKPTLRRWLDDPRVDDIVFFGDSAVGLNLGVDCVARGKKPVLELAGNDGFVVWRDADLERASETLLECFYGSSQICMVPKYALVHPEVAGAFLDRLLARVRELRPGLPEEPDAVLSPVLKAQQYDEMLSDARDGGAELLAGGSRMDHEGRRSPDGLFIEPTVVRVDGLERARELRCVREETFFPLLPVVVPKHGADDSLLTRLIVFVNSNDYGLRNSLWARDPAVIDAFVQRVTNGGLLKVNDSHVGIAPYLAGHGGTGLTGGPHGELHYPMLRTTHLQGVSVATQAVPQRDAGMAEELELGPEPFEIAM